MAHRVDDAEVCDVTVHRVVERVAGHLVGGCQHTCDRDDGGGERQRRQKLPLEFGLKQHREASTGALDEVPDEGCGS